METQVKARIVKTMGTHLVLCQRAPRKWWFELGKHKATDAAFAAALAQGAVLWNPKIKDETQLFSEN